MTPEDELLARYESLQKRWVEVTPGKKVQYTIPSELEVIEHFIKEKGGERVFSADFPEVMRFVCGWEGFTYADVLGAAHAPADPAPFSAKLWAKFAQNRLQWFQTIASDILSAIAAREKARADDAKN